MIKTNKYNVTNVALDNQIIEFYVNKFWADVFEPLALIAEQKHLFLMCKVLFSDTNLGYRTLGHLRRVNFDDKERFIEYIQNRVGLATDTYSSSPISSFEFTYIVNDGLAPEGDRRLLQDLSDKTLSTHSFSNISLHVTMNPKDYGVVMATAEIAGYTRYIVDNNVKTFRIDVSLDGLVNKVRILGATDLEWTDTKLNTKCSPSL